MHTQKRIFAVALFATLSAGTLGAFCAPALAAAKASSDSAATSSATNGPATTTSADDAPANTPAYITAAVHGTGRAPWDVERDGARHPAAVLAFAGVKSGQVVAELVPGEGYYTRILAKLVGSRGKFYAVVPGGDTRGMRLAQRDGMPPAFVPKDLSYACVLGCYEGGRPPFMLPVDQVLAIENVAEFRNLVSVLWEGLNGGELALPEQADVVFSADGYHELHYKELPRLPAAVPGRGGNAPRPLDVAALAKGVFRALKNGGVYVVADYATAKGTGFDVADKLHRTEADAVKAEILAAGFVLDGESQVLSNASDAHTKSADTIAAERDQMDQYLLRFKKPMNAPNTDHRPTKAQEAEIMRNYYGNTDILRADLKDMNESSGQRLRYHFYNPDHTYQEMGRVGEGAGPMQQGTWWWDADGKNCQLHEFPLDERANTVCHDFIIARPLNTITDQYPADQYPNRADKGDKMLTLPGHVYIK